VILNVIDISTRKPVNVTDEQEATQEELEARSLAALVPGQKVTIEQQSWSACQHREMSIDKTQRTVKCAKCGLWLDPVWCLTELFHYYETRVDQRVEDIRRFDEREREKAKARDARKKRPRAARIAQREEELKRAAYNEYQAKLLQLTADRQRLRAAKIEAELESESA
jgi:hypothetical protein